MNKIRLFIIITLVLAVGLIFGAMANAGAPAAPSAQSAAPQAVEAQLGTKFTYQGRLQDGTLPANGSYNFKASLFDASGGGSQQGSTLTLNNVQVKDGLFTLELDFGQQYEGQELWLELQVGQGGSFTKLNPRQPLTGTPYALGLRPGAIMSGSENGAILTLQNLGSGNGLVVNSALSGVRVESATNNGLLVDSVGASGVSVGDAALGLYVANASSDGVQVDSAGGDGFQVSTAGAHGLYVQSATNNGVQVDSANTGVRVDSATTHGLEVGSAGASGVSVGTAALGMYVGNASSHGVWVNSADGTGLRVGKAVVGVEIDLAANGVVVDESITGMIIGQTVDFGVKIENAGTDGLRVESSKGNGVGVISAINGIGVFSATDSGLEVVSASTGVRVESATNHGLEVGSVGASGVSVGSAALGLYVGNASSNGVWVESAGGDGFQVGNAGEHGLHVQSATNNGIQVDSATNGVYVVDATTDGLHVDDALNGVVVTNPADLAAYFNGDVVIDNGACFCLVVLFAVNTSDNPLQPGDIVTLQGSRSGESVGQPLLMEVGPAAAGAPLVGVVHGRGELADIEGSDGKSIAQLVPRDGAAQPGEFVQIVIYGQVQVKASALDQTIALGEKLAVNDSGAARLMKTVEIDGVRLAEDAPSIGIALEELAAGKEGLIWVLVNPQ